MCVVHKKRTAMIFRSNKLRTGKFFRTNMSKREKIRYFSKKNESFRVWGEMGFAKGFGEGLI